MEKLQSLLQSLYSLSITVNNSLKDNPNMASVVERVQNEIVKTYKLVEQVRA